MCIKKVACGLQKVVKEDGREVLEPIFVEVECPDDMHSITGKIEGCKTITPKIVEENTKEVGVIQVTVQNEHDGTHGGHGGATVIDSPTDNNDALTNNNVSPTANIVSPITDNVSPTANIVSPTDNNDSSNGNDSPREIVCIDTGEVFANATQASKATGIARQSIGACCNGKRKSAGGYHWQYL